jgi:hypothetical protein
MSAPYLPVPDLIRCLVDRDTFPAGVSDDELNQLIRAATRLASRAEQELVTRFIKQLRAPERTPK